MKNKMLLMILAIATIFMATTAFAQVYPEGMISYWKFDDCTATDTFGENDGIINGATCDTTDGKVGAALEFGATDYVEVSDHETLNPSYITVEAWVYPTSFGYYRSFVTKKYQSGWGYPYVAYQISTLGATAEAAASVRVNGGEAYYISSTDTTLPINAWSHVATTYDGNTLIIYVNGDPVGENTVPNGPIDYRPYPLYIGHALGSNNYFYGKIDEVAIYNRALTPEEIQQHYQTGLIGQGYELYVPQLSCVGFEPPMAAGPVKVKKNRALPHKAQLFDADGFLVTDADIALPVIQVLYDAGTGGDPVDVTDDALPAGQGTEGNQFVCTEDEKWQFNLKTSNHTGSGTYTVTMEPGDESYTIDPTCEASFVIE